MHSLRRACVDAIRQCELAEQQAKQIQEAATRQRRTALTDAQKKHAQARQGAEGALKEMRSLSQQADRILADLGLTASPLASFVPPAGAGPDELVRLLQNQRGQAREALNRLKATAKALKAEQRKWWKFW